MARSMVTMTTELKGPFWKRGKEIEQATDEMEEFALKEANQDLHAFLATKLKNPTGAYQSRIKIEKHPTFRQITDSGIVYGPVLEWGFRHRATRFKGYRAFRRTRAKVARMMKKAGDVAVAKAVRKLN